jgi:hypothetical protein
MVIHARPGLLDAEGIAADDQPLAQILDHAGGGRAAESVGDRRLADAADAIRGDDLADDGVQHAGLDEVDVDLNDLHRRSLAADPSRHAF